MSRMKDLVVDIIELYQNGTAVDQIAAELGLTELQVVNVLDDYCPEFIEVI